MRYMKNFDDTRFSMNGKLYFLVACELILLWLLASEQINNEEFAGAYLEMPESQAIVVARFLCAIFLHISLADELSQSFEMMKYSLNHPWKFRSYKNAFFVGFC